MNSVKKIGISILLLFIPISFYAFSIGYNGKYISIDSLSQNDCRRFVCLDIKSRKLNFNIDNETKTFIQENQYSSNQLFNEQNLIYKLEKEYILLTIFELKRVESDSIYVSAKYQKFNEKGNIGKFVKIEEFAICKSELLGVIVSPPIKEVKNKMKTYLWFAGTLAVAITTLSIIFGH